MDFDWKRLLFRDGKNEFSKAKISAFLISLGGLLSLVGNFLAGDINLLNLQSLIEQATPLLTGLGVYGIYGAVSRKK